jgi:hypothetical protein
MYGAAHPYDKQWREYRAWIRAAWLVWLGFLAVGLLVIIPRIEEHGQDVITRALSVLWFLAFGVIASHLGGWRCPRCDRAFFAWGPFHHLFARACIHCHLSKCAGSEWRPLG